MQPEISQFLSGMKKAIEQVVLANLTDRFAQEQAGMIAGTLGFLQAVQDKAFHYELLEHHLYRQLLSRIVVLLGDCVATSAIRSQLETESTGPAAHLRPFGSLRGANETLRELLAALIHRQDELPEEKSEALEALLQPFFKELQVRERAWVKALGFDNLPDPVPDLDALLYRDGALHLPSTPGA